jgi:hypothetical protein
MTYSAALMRQPEDRAGLLAVWGDVMRDRAVAHIADARYAWFFEKNPAGPPTIVVTHHVETDQVVACGAAFPRRTQVTGDGPLIPAGILADFAVMKAHRVAGPALALQRRLMNESLARFPFIYGYPNEHAQPIFDRLGYKIVGATSAFSRLLRTGDKLAPILKNHTLGSVAGFFVDRALALGDVRAFVRRPFALRAELLDRADERFDDLWARGRAHYGVTGERTAAYLNWRYAELNTGHHPHRFFCVSHRRTKRLIGYVIYTVKDNSVIVDDLFCDDPRAELDALLLTMAAEMRGAKHRSIYLALLGEPWLEPLLKRLLFLKRPGARNMIARAAPTAPPELTRRVVDEWRWFMVAGELDV